MMNQIHKESSRRVHRLRLRLSDLSAYNTLVTVIQVPTPSLPAPSDSSELPVYGWGLSRVRIYWTVTYHQFLIYC